MADGSNDHERRAASWHVELQFERRSGESRRGRLHDAGEDLDRLGLQLVLLDEVFDSGANTYGGKVIVNPSGGLISKGHPLGATGLAQCAELNWQVRGQADKRQVKDAKIALQHTWVWVVRRW